MRNIKICIILVLLFLLPMTSFAVPYLQLDIDGGVYDSNPEVESIITSATDFDLYAFAKPGGAEIYDDEGDFEGTKNVSIAEIVADTFFVSIAITGDGIDENTDVGSFTFGGQTISNGGVNDLVYGNPPEGSTNPTLAPHGIFDTLYFEYDFQFNAANLTDAYNTADNPGADLTFIDPNMLFQSFAVNTAGLYDGYELHFDLYNLDYKKDPYTRGDFAPFSHDAETVPEPSTLLLLGAGLVGLATCRRKKN